MMVQMTMWIFDVGAANSAGIENNDSEDRDDVVMNVTRRI